MDLSTLKAFIDGYSDRMFDFSVLAAQSGYWAAYFTGARHPKPLATIVSEMATRRQTKEAKSRNSKVEKPEVDVEAFLSLERAFQEKLKRI